MRKEAKAMTVRYRGQQINNYNGKMNPRIAEISYDEATEQTLLDKMKKPLEIRGWSMDNGVGGWAAVEVEDMEEYKEFMKDLLEAMYEELPAPKVKKKR